MNDAELALQKADAECGTIVFLFGAGCSVDCQIPVMSRFMEVARARQAKSPPVLRAEYDKAFEFRNKCATISRYFDRWWDDVEQLMTQAQIMEIAQCDVKKESSTAIAWVIWDVCRRQREQHACGYIRLRPAIESLLANSQSRIGPRPVAITTNYDLNLESAIADPQGDRAMCAYYPGIEPNDQEGFFVNKTAFLRNQYPGVRPVLELIKLHGSVNWFKDDEGNPILECRQENSPVTPRKATWKIQFGGYEATDQRGGPLIVAPTLEKTSQISVIQSQWQSAVLALRNAHALVIVGYSFPETDAFMTRLLAEGVRDNDTMSRFYIVNTDSRETWWNRVESNFAKSWWNFGVHRFVGDFSTFAGLTTAHFAHQKQRPSSLAETLRDGAKIGGKLQKLEERIS